MKHTALTIGPIIKSLGLAHKTREIWAASYFFSLLMEKIIEKLNKNNAIVLPYPDKQELIEDLNIDKSKINSAGIFPDRLILESENGLFAELEEAVADAILKLKSTFDFPCNENELKNYISAHIIEFEYKQRDGKTDDNIIYQTNDYLANCELQANYTAEDAECFLKMFNTLSLTKFYENIFGKKGFPSIIEIASQGLNTENIDFNKEVDNEIWKEIKQQNNNELKTNKKYIAIIQADGDSIGEIIKQVATQGTDKIKEFSKALSSFSLLAAQEIANYNGVPVYTGGDDLLFFAPVTNGDKNIFTLIEQLDKIFEKQVSSKFKTDKKPSMSYGVSISYYKFPMAEALNTARVLLFDKAKLEPKNAIAIKLQKHSGQSFETILYKPLTQNFADLLIEDKGLVLNSVLYQFEKRKVLLEQSLNPSTKASLEYFFDNFYNEDIHNKSRKFINQIKDLLKEVYTKNNNNFEVTIKQINAQLRIIKFLNATKDD